MFLSASSIAQNWSDVSIHLFVCFFVCSQEEEDGLQRQQSMHLPATTGGSHGRYLSALLLMFLLGTFGAALAIIPVLVDSSFQQSLVNRVTNFTSVFGGIFALSVTLTSVYLLSRKKVYVEKGFARFPTNAVCPSTCIEEDLRSLPADESTQLIPKSRFRQIHKNPHFVQILLFGLGGAFYLTIGLLKVAYCQRVGKFHESMTFGEIVATVDETIYLISLGTQLLFFIGYDGAILHNCVQFHYAIALMIADKAWVWVSLTLSGIESIMSDQRHLTVFATPNSSNMSTLHKVLETSQSFLEPFFIEFLTICVGILLCMWNSIGKEPNKRRSAETEAEIDENSPSQFSFRRNYSSLISDAQDRCAFSDITESERDWLDRSEANVSTRSNETVTKLLCGIFLVLLLVGYTVAGFLLYPGLLQYVSDDIEPDNKLYIFFGIKIVIFGPLTTCCAISAHKIYKNTSCSPAAMSSSDYLLLFTTAGCFLWFLLRIISAIAVITVNSEQDKPVGSACYALFFCIICIIQVWVQTQLLLSAHSVHKLGFPISKLTKFCLMFLATLNASEWLQLALERETIIHQKSVLTPALNIVFGDVTTRIVIFLLYPMTEIYRFHTAVMVYEILI